MSIVYFSFAVPLSEQCACLAVARNLSNLVRGKNNPTRALCARRCGLSCSDLESKPLCTLTFVFVIQIIFQYFNTTHSRSSGQRLTRERRWAELVHKAPPAAPDTEQMTTLHTRFFVLCENRTHNEV